MTFRLFKHTFDDILYGTPLPYGHYWKFERLPSADFQKNPDWFEILYRTRASYQCKQGHYWSSSWTMIIFRFNLNYSTGRGTVRMKRFDQRCSKCKDDDEYHVGFCSYKQVSFIVECLLLYILQRCYEGRSHWDAGMEYYIIPASDVPRGGYQCQERFNESSKKK